MPLAFNLAAWPLVKDPMNFVTRTAEYIVTTRDYFNSSIAGNGALLRPADLADAVAAVGICRDSRCCRCGCSTSTTGTRDPLFWMTTSSGVLLIMSFLVSSLGQGYYSMMLFPFLMTVVLRNSVLRNWPAWLAIYGFMSADRWLLGHWPTTGRFLEYMKFTYGWCLMLIVVFCVLYFRYLDAKSENRLDDGIDPVWMNDVDVDEPTARRVNGASDGNRRTARHSKVLPTQGSAAREAQYQC